MFLRLSAYFLLIAIIFGINNNQCLSFKSINDTITTSNSLISKNKENVAAKNKADQKVKLKSPEIKLDIPDPFLQGDTVIVYVKAKNELINPKMTFNKQILKLHKINKDQYRGIAGVDATVKPGEYSLKLEDESGSLNYTKDIKIESANFPIHDAKLAPKQSNIQPSKDESEKIDVARKNVSETNYWSKRPFLKPTKGPVINNYGATRYLEGKPIGDFHAGQDIKAPVGQTIVSIAPGKVLIAEPLERRGGTVVIDHGNGLMSIYLHMSKITAKKGDTIKQGAKIGEVGETGFTTQGSILHWGIYANGIAVNPARWI